LWLHPDRPSLEHTRPPLKKDIHTFHKKWSVTKSLQYLEPNGPRLRAMKKNMTDSLGVLRA
jgi:hypothetical protein